MIVSYYAYYYALATLLREEIAYWGTWKTRGTSRRVGGRGFGLLTLQLDLPQDISDCSAHVVVVNLLPDDTSPVYILHTFLSCEK